MSNNPLTAPHTLLLGFKALSLELLDQNKNLSTRATGFVIAEDDGTFLYTCWHVVTGVDFLQPSSATQPPTRKWIVVHAQDVQQRQPGVQAIGGVQKIEVPLYDPGGSPRWLQESHEREGADLNSLGIRVPKFHDVVRIPIKFDQLVEEKVVFSKDDVDHTYLTAGHDVMIVGYPYGYSSMGAGTPAPIFLKRSIASNQTEQVGVTLLDGGGTPGMSGAPIIAKHDDRWWLFGIYTGIMFPDHMYGPNTTKNDRFAALGMMAQLNIARTFMDVPGLFKKHPG